MIKTKALMSLILSAAMMICTMQPVAAVNYGWKDLFTVFHEMINDTSSGELNTHPKYPVPFTLDGEKMTLPCKLSDALVPGWMICNRITDEYMSKYELVDGFCDRELTLRKDDQEILIDIRNNKPYGLEMKDCDVVRIAVESFPFTNVSMPDFDVYGIRPRGSINQLPKWLRESCTVKSEDMECNSYFDMADQNELAIIEGSDNLVHIFYMFDDEGLIEYVSMDVYP